jgi:hypothetical protein
MDCVWIGVKEKFDIKEGMLMFEVNFSPLKITVLSPFLFLYWFSSR